MDIIAVLFLAGLVVGYFVLAGCDIGLGMLMPYLARTPADRRRVVSAIAPYFLGTEVWLVGAVGVVAGLFPALKSELTTGLGPVLVMLPAGWVARDAGLWFRARVASRAWHALWDTAITVGSWVLALSLGLAVGGMLNGGSLLSPFAVACAFTVAALFALRGAAFGAERLVPAGGSPAFGTAEAPASAAPGATLVAERTASAVNTAENADVAAQATRVIARVALAGAAVSVLAAAVAGGTAVERLPTAAVIVSVLAAVLAGTAGLSGPRLSRHTSAVAVAVPPLLVAAAVELPIAAAPTGTLTLVGFALAPVVPVMLIGQVWLYRMLRRPAPVSGFFA
ncbi:MAG: cytochrome d ubiquinol oxidase subunit II [Nocardiopsaceae bacterium]|nr:cytochrome d ubiquinol oxidase subunit II [Nocardiopsaceae bacterium]